MKTILAIDLGKHKRAKKGTICQPQSTHVRGGQLFFPPQARRLIEQPWIIGYGDQIDVQRFPWRKFQGMFPRGELECLETDQ